MEQAATAYIEGLTAATDGPMWVFAIGVLAIFAVVLIKAFPMYREFKTRQLDIEAEREKRKAEEARMRDERERENAAIAARQVEAQERSTAAMNAMTAQMAVMESRIELSQQGSATMQNKVDGIAVEVHDIHAAIVHG